MSEKAEKIAALARSKILGGKIISLQYSDKNNPRFAKILLQNFQNKRVALSVELFEETPETALTFALLWFFELEKLKTKQAEKLWIFSPNATRIAALRSALKEEWRDKTRVFDVNFQEAFAETAETKKAKTRQPPKLTRLAKDVISLAPNEILPQGSNLSFRGLPFFAFGRGENRIGIEKPRRPLTESNWSEARELIENLKLYRSADSPNKSHLFYKLAPEAWLESLLRRDVSRLDANLILSPLYNQFRVSDEKIDLLALREDGRLVVIELKVSPNREHLFQAVGYWQEIERQRLAGNLTGAFDGLKIADQPPLIYLVAPRSAYFKDFDKLARAISPAIEIYRFEISENWRQAIKIIERRRI